MLDRVSRMNSTKNPGTDSPDSLTGWKEIAHYLKVTTRTAQNWERHWGMPVYRRGSGNGSRVTGSKAELDQWRTQNPLPKGGRLRRWIRKMVPWTRP